MGYYGHVVGELQPYWKGSDTNYKVVHQTVEVAVDSEDDGQMTSVNGLQYDYQRRGKSGRRQSWVERDPTRRQPFIRTTALDDDSCPP